MWFIIGIVYLLLNFITCTYSVRIHISPMLPLLYLMGCQFDIPLFENFPNAISEVKSFMKPYPTFLRVDPALFLVGIFCCCKITIKKPITIINQFAFVRMRSICPETTVHYRLILRKIPKASI